jgi:pimeloyl-ACP methyl ester carboxylesterase
MPGVTPSTASTGKDAGSGAIPGTASDSGGTFSPPTGDDGGSSVDGAASLTQGNGAGSSDPGVTGDGAPPLALTDAGGPCTITPVAAQCNSLPAVTVTDAADSRLVYYAQPVGAAPAGGWPAVVLYQGTGFGPAVSWNAAVGPGFPFGGYYQVAVVAALIDAGFVVIQPPCNGAWWDGNFPNYETSPDAAFIPALLTAMGNGTFGSIDMQRLYATGISSGGYMTSRMAVSYRGRFRALAIESASYATCGAVGCSAGGDGGGDVLGVIPATLPSDHPPTLFLHGGQDPIVPISQAQAYYQELTAQGFDTKFVEDPSAGHQWLSVAPQNVVKWFTTH